MSLILTLLASPAGRLAGLVLLAVLAGGGLYLKGRHEGRAACLAEGERDVVETIARANRARADADERLADPRRLREPDAFRRE
ncbi:hypothetical protein [Ancylobacter sp. SL191]|uniref:hypothetical protein n=1 Tax=Ancylobacter sp. SL191 TaxID=2995166 RepID=UPI00226FAC81|nr:hypothetical protein [Ancylobacter sp. SL191]WAC27259.1 hypothetical protein OU996_20035 [Ancylobacter sp. SL191]